MTDNILIINPGSTSTKISVYRRRTEMLKLNLSHSVEELNRLKNIEQHQAFRKYIILQELEKNGFRISDLAIIMSRGGLVKPISSGVYEINPSMLKDLEKATFHASNLGAMIAYELATQNDIKSYIANPVVVDELEDIARFSGHALFKRKSIFHALNQKSVAHTYAKSQNKSYNQLNLIIVHMGGGISVTAHKKGKAIDTNQALDGDGPFSPERSGTLPMGEVIRMAFSRKYTREEMLKMIVGKGGLYSYLGTNDAKKIEKSIKRGDKKTKEVYKAMGYQIAKEIGAMAVVLKGNIDAIILTGGMAYSKFLTDFITSNVHFLAPIKIYPGEDEMKTLAENAYNILRNKATINIY